jgi:hypothetical protein
MEIAAAQRRCLAEVGIELMVMEGAPFRKDLAGIAVHLPEDHNTHSAEK